MLERSPSFFENCGIFLMTFHFYVQWKQVKVKRKYTQIQFELITLCMQIPYSESIISIIDSRLEINLRLSTF